MTALTVQPSLLDLGDEIAPGPLTGRVQRTPLAHGAWVDTLPGWFSGADALFDQLLDVVAWRAERRRMYDHVVDVPRLLCFYGDGEPLPHPALEQARDALARHYATELREPFRTAGFCLYRDGRDSVAWHGDTIGRGLVEDTMVAILSLGAPRPLLLRPRPGQLDGPDRHDGPDQHDGPGAHDGPGMQDTPGPHRNPPAGTVRRDLGHGDLLVMGGSCQRTWEHAVPKTARATGPRISVQFRPRGVR